MRNRTEGERQECPAHLRRVEWMRERGLTCVAIGRRLGVTRTRVSMIMSSGLAPRVHIEALRSEFGMPEELLPEPSREKPGPMSAAEREALGLAG